jgi:hypothetical protein
MAKPGPDTSKNGRSEEFAHCSGYAYDDAYLYSTYYPADVAWCLSAADPGGVVRA